MTIYYASAELEVDGVTHEVRAFWDKHRGHGVDVVAHGYDLVTVEHPVYFTNKAATLKRFATVVKRYAEMDEEQ